MESFLARFSWDAIKDDKYVRLGMLGAWLAVLFCTVHSIFAQQSFSRRQRVFWISFVILAPVIGVLCYLPVSMKIEDYQHLFLWKKKKP
ncbi:MAG: PLDc N-terminal domain-containing protein [Verrucomicrobia bacterium]|nr:PLDc N-terminal domain-containing protein [Verrucomicrobiota bacterium]